MRLPQDPLDQLTTLLEQDHSIGARLRSLRQDSGISLRDLATRLGISASALSQIENGKMQPSVNRLISIVSALGVPVTSAFHELASPAEPVVTVSRHENLDPIHLSSGVDYERISPVPLPGIDLYKTIYQPQASTSPGGEFLTHHGFEVGYMIHGTLDVEYEDATHTLTPGDSISHPATKPHRIVNTSEHVVAEMIWVTLR